MNFVTSIAVRRTLPETHEQIYLWSYSAAWLSEKTCIVSGFMWFLFLWIQPAYPIETCRSHRECGIYGYDGRTNSSGARCFSFSCREARICVFKMLVNFDMSPVLKSEMQDFSVLTHGTRSLISGDIPVAHNSLAKTLLPIRLIYHDFTNFGWFKRQNKIAFNKEYVTKIASAAAVSLDGLLKPYSCRWC